MIVQNLNHKLEEKIDRYKVKISGVQNSIPDDDLENTVVSICKDSEVEIDPKNIRG